jgi:hypothetical protein
VHKECPENGNTASIPTYCNCKLVEGEEFHSSDCRGCRHSKEEMRKRKSQRVPKTRKRGRVLSCTAEVSFTAVLRSNIQKEQQSHPSAVAYTCPVTVGDMSAPSPEPKPTSTKSVSSGS